MKKIVLLVIFNLYFFNLLPQNGFVSPRFFIEEQQDNGGVCPACNGTGEIRLTCRGCKGAGVNICSGCDGRGTEICKGCDGRGGFMNTQCKYCQGKGSVICNNCNGRGNTLCHKCNGTGYITETCRICFGSGIRMR